MAELDPPAAQPKPGRPKACTLFWAALLPALVTALAAALRCPTLSVQSLWLDEVGTAVEAGRPLPDLLLALLDPRQGYPLYILGMRLWTGLSGSGEAALRWPSAIAGACAVPLLYLLGRRLFGRPAGWLAAALLALSPMAVWYSQEAKAYAITLLLSLASWLVLWEAVERRARGPWWAFGALTVVSLLTHRLIAVLALVGQLVYLVYAAHQGRFTLRNRRLLVLLLVAVLLAALAGLWLVVGQSGASRQFGTRRDWTAPLDAFSQLSLRITPHAPEAGRGPDRRPWLVPFAGVALAGLLALARESRGGGPGPRSAVFLLSFLLAPPATFFALYLIRPLYYERYMLGTLPAYLLLLALGLVSLGRWALQLYRSGDRALGSALAALALAAGAALVAASGREVQTYNLSGQPHKEQFREATRYLQEHLHPGDLVVVHPNYLVPAVEYYQPRCPRVPLELHVLRDMLTEDYGFSEFETDMTEMATGRRRAWLLLAPYHAPTQDPRNWVFEWFWLNPFWHCGEQHLVGIDLYCVEFFSSEYRLGRIPTPQIPLDALFGGEIWLYGADLEPFQQPLQPGDTLPLTLYLQALRAHLPNSEAVIRLVAQEGGKAWAEEVRQPLGGYLPTSSWLVRDEVLDGHELHLPADLPAGPYTVTVGLRHVDTPAEMLRLPDGSAWAEIGTVEVAEGGQR